MRVDGSGSRKEGSKRLRKWHKRGRGEVVEGRWGWEERTRDEGRRGEGSGRAGGGRPRGRQACSGLGLRLGLRGGGLASADGRVALAVEARLAAKGSAHGFKESSCNAL